MNFYSCKKSSKVKRHLFRRKGKNRTALLKLEEDEEDSDDDALKSKLREFFAKFIPRSSKFN